ncbi:MAG: DNA topoisomerase (ATP-hydrolyzing) subunit B [Bacillota bacterium]
MADIDEILERAVDSERYDEGQIQVLEGLEAVRKRPSMYIGSTSERGLHHLVYEIVDNSVDEALAGRCDTIQVTLRKDNTVFVRDNGSGIPVGIHPQMGIPTLQVVHTVLHAGGKFGGGAYTVSGGLHGVGASVVNALSEFMEVQVYRDGKIYRQRYEKGATMTELETIGETNETGTQTIFKPDGTIFETVDFSYDTLLTRFREMAFLNKIITIVLRDEREEEPIEKVLHYDGGIISFVQYLNKNKEIINQDVIYFETEKEGSYVEIAMQYNDGYNESIFSYANNIATTEGGTHLTGFKAAITKVLNDYSRKSNLLKEADKNLSGEDVREGLAAIISVKLKDPQFEGQTKTKLGNNEIRGLCEQAVSDKLTWYLEENPQIAKALLEKCVSASRARDAARKARELARRKNVFESNSLPGKLSDCSETDPTQCEIYIVEGDSAGGSAKQGRDRKIQAILPLWGKMMNVEKQRLDKVYSNEKLSPVILALGSNIGADFDLSKLRYHKVIIMADADVDGSHIRTLLLTFLFRHMRPLVEAGHVYIAQPPLFKVAKGKEEFYAYTDKEVDAQCLVHGWKREDCGIQRYKGLGEMNPEQLWETTMNPETRTILQVTLDDAVSADETFNMLMGEKVEPRKDFIQLNAKKVANLDI